MPQLQMTDEVDRMAQYIAAGMMAMNKANGSPLAIGYRNDPTSTTPVGPNAHGGGGVFNIPGGMDMVISMMLAPLGGIAAQLPVLSGSMETNGTFGGDEVEKYTIVTGVTQGASESFSNQPTTPCADGARPGTMKVCTVVSPMGRYRFSPRAPIDIQEIGNRYDRCDPMTLRLLNAMPIMGPLVPNVAGVSAENTLLNEWVKRSFEMLTSMQRFFAQETYVANPASNSGSARRFTGLDLLINENNKVDAFTSNVCTAANSDLKDFGFDMVNGTGRDVVQYMEMMYTYLNWNSTRTGMGAWDGVVAMRPELFEELVKVWPVRAYQEMLGQMAAFTNGRVVVDGRQALDFRNDLLNNLYLPLKGRRVPIVLDDGIAEDNVTTNANLIAGQYASDIYFVPLRAHGIPVTYWRLFDFNNGQANAFVQALGIDEAFTSDGGFFAWNRNFKNGCLDWNVTVKPRLTCRATNLAGRLQNVGYEPLQHLRSYDPASSYFFDGGRTNTVEDSFYTEWSTSTPVNI